MDRFHLSLRLGQAGTVQTVGTVDVGGVGQGADHRPRAAGIDRKRCGIQPGHLADPQRIAPGVTERDIARNHRHRLEAAEVPGTDRREQGMGVVNARVAVDDGGRHGDSGHGHGFQMAFGADRVTCPMPGGEEVRYTIWTPRDMDAAVSTGQDGENTPGPPADAGHIPDQKDAEFPPP